MTKRELYEQKTEEILLPIVEENGFELVDVEYVKEKILEKVKVKEIVVNHVGPVIGSHSGPGTVAIFYFAKGRE